MKNLIDRFHHMSVWLIQVVSGAWPKLILITAGILSALWSGLPLAWAAVASSVLLDLLLVMLAGYRGLVGQIARLLLAIDLSLDLIAIVIVPATLLGGTIGMTVGYVLAFVGALTAAVSYAEWLASRESGSAWA